MVCAQERDCFVGPIASRTETEPVLPCPENPFNFPGYIPPCSRYLYFNPGSDRDPYSDVPFKDVADKLGVCMHQTSNGQPLAITSEGLRFIDTVGQEQMPRAMIAVHGLIQRITNIMYPPDAVEKIMRDDRLYSGEYKRLVDEFIHMAQGCSSVSPRDGKYRESTGEPVLIGMEHRDSDNRGCEVSYLGMGAQHLVFRVVLKDGKKRNEFVAKTPSMHAILGFRGKQAVGRIHPLISSLLRTETLRQHLESEPAETYGVSCCKTLLATPYLLLEEYYGNKTNPSILNVEVWRSLRHFDSVTRAYLQDMKASPDDPISRIMKGVVRPDIYTRKMGPKIEGHLDMKIQFNAGYTRGDRAFLSHNIALDPISHSLVCYDPFVLHPLSKPEGVPQNPRAPWRKGMRGGKFNPAEFERYFPSPNNPPLLK